MEMSPVKTMTGSASQPSLVAKAAAKLRDHAQQGGGAGAAGGNSNQEAEHRALATGTKQTQSMGSVVLAKMYAHHAATRHKETRMQTGSDIPGPGEYTPKFDTDISEQAKKRGVQFAGKNITRELTQVDATYREQLSTPAVGQYDVDIPLAARSQFGVGPANLKRVPSVRFSESDRNVEAAKLYLGPGTGQKLGASPGPGAYDGINKSSFRGYNRLGPPHSFGATSHDIKYDSDSPGPLAYNASKPLEYSPQFGFGASKRGEGDRTFPGEEFMTRGRETPGPVLPAQTTFGVGPYRGPSFTFLGHGTRRKYPKRYEHHRGGQSPSPPTTADGRVGSRSPSPTPSPHAERALSPAPAPKTGKSHAKPNGTGGKKLAARPTTSHGKPSSNDKDYSWLYAEDSKSPTADSSFSRGARPARRPPAVTFGNAPRFNPSEYVAHSPSVGKLYTDSPGPAYAPPTTIGKGPAAIFSAAPRMKPDPIEREKLETPGPGQYNVTLDQRLAEECVLEVLEATATTVDAMGRVVPLPSTLGKRPTSAPVQTNAQPELDLSDIVHTTIVEENENESDSDDDEERPSDGAASAAPAALASGRLSPELRAEPAAAEAPGSPEAGVTSEGGVVDADASSPSHEHAVEAGTPSSSSKHPLRRAHTKHDLVTLRPMSQRTMSKSSMLSPDDPVGPPVPLVAAASSSNLIKEALLQQHVDVEARRLAMEKANKARVVDNPSLPRPASVKFSTSSRDVEFWKRYHGAECALKAVDSPGPGEYDLAKSSFGATQSKGKAPPHTFGATNHDLSYTTDSPGPSAYNAAPPKKYSPQFGFGASARGAGDGMYGGSEMFMTKGTLGPGMHTVHANLSDQIKGGVISASKRNLGQVSPDKASIPGPGSYNPKT